MRCFCPIDHGRARRIVPLQPPLQPLAPPPIGAGGVLRLAPWQPWAFTRAMQVLKIDHVHVEVVDRLTAAAWFNRVFGLRPHKALAGWADDPMGPLILEAADGQPALSLFARGCAPPSRDATIAFRVSGADFLTFRDRVPDHGLTCADGTPSVAVDHGLSWSIYICDPDGNRFEVTTYDYAEVAPAI